MSVGIGETAGAAGVAEASRRSAWRAWFRGDWRARLWPLESGRGAIPALDGLRALAALSVLVYHATSVAGAKTVIAGHDLTWLYFYTESGVDLFFTLSGFLLFLPYARAILAGKSDPRALTFYRRRALRILPAYYACLLVVAVVETLMGSGPSAGNIGAHLVLLHDIWPAFNRTISGPFWTLAVEWQFYLILPWVAWLIGRFSAGSARRLALGPLALIAVAVGIREAAGQVEAHWTALPSGWAPAVDWALRVAIGSQGKYLEVFGVGMLCAVAYLVAVERGGLAWSKARWVGLALLTLALVVYLGFAPLVYMRRNEILAQWYRALHPADAAMMLGPLALGICYGALLLGALLGPGLARAALSWAPLRFIGLISYSLYLWHESVINVVYPRLPHTAIPSPLNGVVALAVGFGVAIPLAYLSYQLIERPFLKLR